MKRNYKNSFKHGLILVNVLVFAVIAIIITTAMVTWGTTLLKNSKQLVNREQAFEISEAGIDYYRWHLAHAQNDYYDGNASTTSGPYIHTFADKDGNVIGQYALTITPPATGTTVVMIKSKGTVLADPSISRSIQAVLAIPSFAKYAAVANDNLRFGAGTETYGPISSNGGIRFDGIAHNIVTSALSSYVDPDLNDGVQRYGVYTTGDPTPPTAPPADASTFLVGRVFPVPVVDFTALTANLSSIKSIAQAGNQGGNSYFSSSGAQGYHIVLKTNDTFDLYKVTSLTSLPNKCSNDNKSQSQDGWGSWTINNQSFVHNYPFPANGVVFVEDNLWVDGAINSARLTIAAGTFPDNPNTRKSITVNNDLNYTNFNGQDVLGLIAQNNINVGYGSDDNLVIDAALVAQNARVGRYYYNSNCGTSYIRSSITLYGMIGTALRYGFAYTDNTGYDVRDIIYDGNLLYGPPPSFPLSSTQYSTISWGEVP